MADLVVVTGGANGIGAGIVRRLAAEGYAVLICDLDAAAGERLAAELTASSGAVGFCRCDVGSAPEAAALRGAVEGFGSPLLGIVNNAGVFPRTAFLDITMEEWARVVGINLTGPFLVTQALAPLLMARGDGVVVNLASGLSYRGDALGVHYTATKHGIRGLTKALALALAPHGIRVNAVAPGAVATAQGLAGRTREQLVARGKEFPLRRLTEPSDVAGIVAFLLSPDAAFVTGQTIPVNGGADMP